MWLRVLHLVRFTFQNVAVQKRSEALWSFPSLDLCRIQTNDIIIVGHGGVRLLSFTGLLSVSLGDLWPQPSRLQQSEGSLATSWGTRLQSERLKSQSCALSRECWEWRSFINLPLVVFLFLRSFGRSSSRRREGASVARVNVVAQCVCLVWLQPVVLCRCEAMNTVVELRRTSASSDGPNA